MQLILLDEGVSADDPPSEAAVAFRQRCLHLFSLLNAVASNYLRDGMDLRKHYCRFVNPLLTRKQLSRCATQKVFASAPTSSSSSSLFPEILRARGYGGDDIILITQNLQASEHRFRRKNPVLNVFGYSWGPSHNRLAAEALPMPVIGGISEAELAALEVTPERVRLVVVWIHRALMARSGGSGDAGWLSLLSVTATLLPTFQRSLTALRAVLTLSVALLDDAAVFVLTLLLARAAIAAGWVGGEA